MRIVGGQFKGRRIQPPAKFKGRPTTDFAKEALFNILANRAQIDGAEVLDLFAGTGALGYEFASRGAVSITAVERDPIACGFIRKTYDTLGYRGAVVVRDDVHAFIGKHRRAYDIVVADPPYDDAKLVDLPFKVFNAALLKPQGLFVLEHGADVDLSEKPGFTESRRYGAVNFSFFTFEE
jgi:16S rRNA (guanine(966)-N(2))-methyltransferase RsmD